jgi:hypothetical protein
MLSYALFGCAHPLNTLKDTIKKVQSLIAVYKPCSHHNDLFVYLLAPNLSCSSPFKTPISDHGLTGTHASHRRDVYWQHYGPRTCLDHRLGPDPKVYTYLISKGVNGFFCDLSMIRPWLESSRLDFGLVIKTNSLQYQYGLTNHYAEYHGNVYWWHHESRHILDAMSQRPGHHPKVDELLTA